MSNSTKKTARPVMVQSTQSHAGKSVVVAAVCRILRDRGLSVAPFKAQNMALNSYVTRSGGEIGRAQAFQAEAAGLPPTTDMNPVLLKPTADSVCQVVIQGRVHGVMSAVEYHAFKREAAGFVRESYERLAREHDVIVIEGAGSPAEVNLREGDIANMGAAEMFDSPVVLIGDIDRGGVFAQIVGTMELLTEAERARVKGFIINKFRGDMALLKPGLDFLEARTHKPVLGVVPYMKEIHLPDEDGVSLDDRASGSWARPDRLAIAVVRLPRISNFTDFDPLGLYADVDLAFIDDPEHLAGADMAIIPGSKNTVEDLLWLKERGFEEGLRALVERGGRVAGICGGLQMLGSRVDDPLGVESGMRGAEGLGLLDTSTVMAKEKKTFQVVAEACSPSGSRFEVDGYEIHMGETVGKGCKRPFATITSRNGVGVEVDDGAVSADGRVWGTHIHGIFDNDGFREAVLNDLRAHKGMDGLDKGRSYSVAREAAIETLARTVQEAIPIDELLGIIGLHGAPVG